MGENIMDFEFTLAKQSQEVLGKVNTTVDGLYAYELGIITEVLADIRERMVGDTPIITEEQLKTLETMNVSSLRTLETMRLKVRSACNDKNN